MRSRRRGSGSGSGRGEARAVRRLVNQSQSISRQVGQSISQSICQLSLPQSKLSFSLSHLLFLPLSFFLALPLGSPLLEEECAIFEIPFGIPGLRAP